jgi:8-oxo-dGTP pyrophosphatase MutT (NUDIX family)
MTEQQKDKATGRASLPTLDQVSAGGVVFRRHDSGPQVIIVSVGDPPRWQLPKGLVDAGETAEQAALREVREEAGVDAVIVDRINTVEYWYVATRGGRRVRYHKFVHFFLLEYQSGDVRDHDWEVREARWVRAEEAGRMLAFKGEREAAAKARAMIEALTPGGFDG